MFTIKATYSGGHEVYECAHYRYNDMSNVGQTTGDPSPESIVLYAADRSVIRSIDITGTVYAMNANGKTVDTFHAKPTSRPDELMRGGSLGATI